LDDNGVNDLAVGARFDDDGGFNHGAVWILFMGTDGKVDGFQKISDTAGNFGGTLDPIDNFGSSVANLGDLDGDGVIDLAVGAINDDGDGVNIGAVWILFMNDDGTVKSEQRITDSDGGFTGSFKDDVNNNFGFSVTGIGDLDNDGVNDLAVGAQNDNDGFVPDPDPFSFGGDLGAVWILFMNGVPSAADTTPPDPPTITSPADGTITSENIITISGDAETGSTVEIFDGATSLGTTTATSPWSFTTPQLDIGDHIITATSTDAADNTSSASSSVTITIEPDVTVPPGGDIVTEPDGTTTITAPDASGSEVQIEFPPGSLFEDAVFVVDNNGANILLDFSGGTAAYPPGKTFTFTPNQGSNFVCIVDTPDSVLLQGLPNCGANDPSTSQVVFQCPGSEPSQFVLADGTLGPDYVCAENVDPNGIEDTTWTVTGVRFSFLTDAGDTDGIADSEDNCPLASNPDQADADVDGIGDVCDPDDDNDGTLDVVDTCPTTFGLIEGCPVGDKSTIDLHTVTLGAKGPSKNPIDGAEVRVFDRNDPDFQTLFGKNPSGTEYFTVFDADVGRVGSCTTVAGMCTVGEETVGDYLVIVEYFDSETGKTVYTGKPKSPEDFDATGLAEKDFQVLKVVKKNGSIQFGGGNKVVVTGSILEVVYTATAIWEPGMNSYIYPYIFTSDSAWTVDMCMYLPAGYAVVGIYDEFGNLITVDSCVQTFVSGEAKVAAFEVLDVGSPKKFSVVVDLDAKTKGKPTNVKLNTDTWNDNANGQKAADKQEDKGQNKKKDKGK